MVRPERPVRRLRAALSVLFACAAAAAAAAGAWAGGAPAVTPTPVPLAPCRIGQQRLTALTPLATVRRAVAGAFPRATFADMAGSDPDYRRLRVTEGGAPLMIVNYHARNPARAVASIELLSPRFELMPGVRPGVPLSVAARSLGQVTLSYNPEIGVEAIDAPGLLPTLANWEGKGCVVNPRMGPGRRIGLYPAGTFETHRYRPGAVISQIEIGF
ncbi:hypothetical protein [Sphingomonas montana]|uniref:hypothetical protein n=1 Tax=Sphingomonas montana TaxID=1843236 RepID=UPI0013ECFBD4|nr:hypothetical protein [Sphingomonas montana]